MLRRLVNHSSRRSARSQAEPLSKPANGPKQQTSSKSTDAKPRHHEQTLYFGGPDGVVKAFVIRTRTA
jgi:hypothetical protein